MANHLSFTEIWLHLFSLGFALVTSLGSHACAFKHKSAWGPQWIKAPHRWPYLSTLQWAVDTADLYVAMFGPWDDLQSLKITAQNHHVTTWCIGLSRDKTVRGLEKWTWYSKIHPARIAWRVTWTALVPELLSRHQTCHHMTALKSKQIRLEFHALFLWHSKGAPHMNCDSLWLFLFHKRT